MSSGYIERLLARARGQAGGVRPAAPPLFAPESTLAQELAPLEPNEPPGGHASSHPREQAAAGPTTEPGSRQPAQTTPAARQARMEPDPRPAAAPPQNTAPATAPPAAAAPPAEHTALPALTRGVDLQPLAAPAHAPDRELPGPAHRDVEPTAQKPKQPTQVLVEKLLLPLQAAPAAASPRPGAANPRSAAGQSQPPAPAPVRISIGRIEVRAVTPAAPAPAPKVDPHPAMGLDEYLRRLNEETR